MWSLGVIPDYIGGGHVGSDLLERLLQNSLTNLDQASSLTYYEMCQFVHKTNPSKCMLSMQSKSKNQNKQLPVSLYQKTQCRHSGAC